MPAKKLHPYELEQESIKTAQFQDYVPENTSVASVKEVLFFVNIACFCVFLAIFSFMFLSLKLNTVFYLQSVFLTPLPENDRMSKPFKIYHFFNLYKEKFDG